MINIKARNNLHFPGLEPWQGKLNEKKLELLNNSWAGIFRDHILLTIPLGGVSRHFSEKQGRPSKELLTVVGACILQQIFDLTDVETRDQLAFNEQWHYALDSFDPQDQVISLKTLWNVRSILVSDDLARPILNAVTDHLAEHFDVDTRFQRLDSVHINSDMAKLGRVRLLSRSIAIFLKNLKRHHKVLYESDSLAELRSRYEKEENCEYFGNVKPSESSLRLEQIAQDLYVLLEAFKADKQVRSMYSYKTMERAFGDHCQVEEGEVLVKPANEVASDSLQNPSDPDAGYDGHKGQGYQAQLMETYTPENCDDEQSNTLNLITYVDVEPADCYDGAALEPALEETQSRECLPEELSADTSYGSEENRGKAAGYGVELISPVPGKKPAKDLSDFEFNKATFEVEKCPQGHCPQAVKQNKNSSCAIWSKDVCNQCPLRDSCPVKEGKKGYLLNYKRGEIELLFRRQYEQSDEFKEKYRWRSGIEATNSRYIHMTGARRLRYRGLGRVDYAARLKALGINIFRTVRFIVRQGSSAPLLQNLDLDAA